jgi:Flp pilus assembly protein TadG
MAPGRPERWSGIDLQEVGDVEPQREAPKAQTEHKGRWFSLRSCRDTTSGQAIVEFALVSMAFFMIVFGTIDFGRAIFMYSQLHNAVREGARYGKMYPTNTSDIKSKVTSYGSGLSIAAADITVSCSPGACSASSVTALTVTAETDFTAITQELLGISPITLTSSATVQTE